VFCADRDCLTSNKKCRDKVLIAIPNSLYGFKWRYDLEMTKECVQVEICVRYNCSLLTGSHYFSSDCDIKIIENYLNFLEVNLNFHLYQELCYDFCT
jgi:hypothetical protein